MKSTRQTVIITGASQGIGRATAELFAHHGWQVLVNYYHSREAAEHLCRELRQAGLIALPFQADVSSRSAVDAMFEFCRTELGSVDLLINNAGIAQTKLFCDITEAEWDRICDVNLKGVYLCSQAALRQMLPLKQGKIINIASIWGMVGGSCEVPYSAVKAGVIGLTKALAKELGPSQIQVNCIAPGPVDTAMLSEYTVCELDALREEIPLGRLGTPRDIAACALFLASKEAGFITGQVLSPNGGMVI